MYYVYTATTNRSPHVDTINVVVVWTNSYVFFKGLLLPMIIIYYVLFGYYYTTVTLLRKERYLYRVNVRL